MCLRTRTDLAARLLMAFAVNEAVTQRTVRIQRSRNFADMGRRQRLLFARLKSLALSRTQPSGLQRSCAR
jgi:hypothetical protein